MRVNLLLSKDRVSRLALRRPRDLARQHFRASPRSAGGLGLEGADAQGHPSHGIMRIADFAPAHFCHRLEVLSLRHTRQNSLLYSHQCANSGRFGCTIGGTPAEVVNFREDDRWLSLRSVRLSCWASTERNPPRPSNFSRTSFLLMADYYSILVRAVSSLDPNTPAARRRLYDRACSALLSGMQNAYPPIARSEIMVAQMALDTAIGQVEADACLTVLERAVKGVGESARPCPYDQPNSIASRGLIPTRVSEPHRIPAIQNVEGRRSPSGIRRLFRWRARGSIKNSEEEGRVRDTWLTELLDRASRETNYEQDFAPSWAR